MYASEICMWRAPGPSGRAAPVICQVGGHARPCCLCAAALIFIQISPPIRLAVPTPLIKFYSRPGAGENSTDARQGRIPIFAAHRLDCCDRWVAELCVAAWLMLGRLSCDWLCDVLSFGWIGRMRNLSSCVNCARVCCVVIVLEKIWGKLQIVD